MSFPIYKSIGTMFYNLLMVYSADNNPPTNLTGDVRGVCIPPSGANGNIKLVTTIIPSLARAANNTLWGLTPA